VVKKIDLDEKLKMDLHVESLFLSRSLLQDFDEMIKNNAPNSQININISSIVFNGILMALKELIDRIPDDELQDSSLEYVNNFLRNGLQ
jgi:hypothetical protein